MRNTPILTIAIPTYNRPQLLTQQISRLLPQLTSEIKVIIYDNNSTTPAKEAIGDLCTGEILIVTNPTNVGADANICRCFENCDTEWLWVLSDDDIIMENAIATVIDSIKSNRDSIFINFKADQDHVTEGLSEFCRCKPDYANAFCISLCLYNSYKLKPYLFFYYNYLSSWHGQLILVLKYLEDNCNGKCSFLSNEIIHIFTPTEWPKIDFIDRIPIFLSAFKDQSKELVKFAFQDRIVFHLLLFLSNLRKSGCINRRTQLFYLIKGVAPFKLRCLLVLTNFKQLVIFTLAFIHSGASTKFVSLYRGYRNRHALS